MKRAMGKRRKKIGVLILLILFVPAVALIMVVLVRTNSLERFLRRELVRRTSIATDGFYRLSFDKLQISPLNGELSIRGIRLVPDSAVFHEWEQRDSLPLTYVDAYIGMIGFKGINMTWQRDFRRLHFQSFEILRPDIKVFDSYYSTRTIRKRKTGPSKTLYEMISPYIDTLTVKRLNLNHAVVSYTVVNPHSPILYGLQDVSFHAYQFRLDRNSSKSGKLLYCNDFDFNTNRPQLLIANNDFTLRANKIRLDTKDSIVLVSHLALASQDTLWKKSHQTRSGTLDAAVDSVTLHGIAFRRARGLNYLVARSFDIISPSIRAFHLSDQAAEKKSASGKHRSLAKIDRDSLVKSLSLYEIISPVLHEVSIRRIGIDHAQMQYLLAIKGTTETFKLKQFNLLAKDFRIDSMAENRRGLHYARCFAFEATDITGQMNARNHRFSVKRLALDTEAATFAMEKISVRPLSTSTHNDYLSGDIAALRISGLKYDKGLSADTILISRPTARYVTAEGAIVKSSRVQKKNTGRSDVYDLLYPFLRYLSVSRFRIDNAEMAFNDRRQPDPIEYRLSRFNFRVADILFDEQTRRQSDLLFDYGEIGFDFSRFDNYLPGKNYRITVDDCSFSTVKGILSLQNIHLIPQDTLFRRSHLFLRASSPALLISGLKRLPDKPAKNLYFTSLLLQQPQLFFQKEDGSHYSLRLKEITADDVAWDSTAFRMHTIALTSPVINIDAKKNPQQQKSEKRSAKPLPLSFPPELFQSLSALSDQISLDQFRITDARIDYAKEMADGATVRHSLDTTNLSVEGLAIHNTQQKIDWDSIRFDTRDIAFPIDNGMFTLHIGRVGLLNNNVQLEQLHLDAAYPKAEFSFHHPHHSDWFGFEASRLQLNDIDVSAYLHNKMVRIGEVKLKDATLQNLKNKKADAARHVVPMIYSGLYKSPLSIDIRRIALDNFAVIYEELPKKGDAAGKFYLKGVNGTLDGLTNRPASRDQYMTFDITGRMMDKGPFRLTWQMPLDSTNDLFHLNIRITDFRIPYMNEFFTPLTSAKIQSGYLNEMTFSADASSKGASARMQLLYEDLYVNLMKQKNGEMENNKFVSSLINHFIKHDNPEKKGKKQIVQKPREVQVTIKRDPYHSTFNYMWQILRPSLTESVGVSQSTQQKAVKVVSFVNKVKSFFYRRKATKDKKK